MMRSVTLVLTVVTVSKAFPNFHINNVGDSGGDEIGGVMEYLRGFGETLYKQPNNEVGDMVKAWVPSKGLSNPEELGTYVEGDILFPESHTSRNGLRAVSARWPNGRVPYVISGSFSKSDLATINAAIAEYHQQTCVRFVPRTAESDYLVFKNGQTGCWSSVGRVGGAQEINLQSPGCLVQKGTVMHEMMHALGFLHEQSRWERDNFVDINYQNIMPGRENNFIKAEKSTTDDMGVEYDYGSVMHYSATAFSANGQPTIVPKSANAALGQRESVSHKDVQKIRRMYQCKKAKARDTIKNGTKFLEPTY